MATDCASSSGEGEVAGGKVVGKAPLHSPLGAAPVCEEQAPCCAPRAPIRSRGADRAPGVGEHGRLRAIPSASGKAAPRPFFG